jgi:hypothetical protein
MEIEDQRVNANRIQRGGMHQLECGSRRDAVGLADRLTNAFLWLGSFTHRAPENRQIPSVLRLFAATARSLKRQPTPVMDLKQGQDEVPESLLEFRNAPPIRHFEKIEL